MMFSFVVYSKNAWSSPSFKDLTQGRIDILVHSIIHSLFVSENIRKDVELNLFLAGPPDPIKHIQIIPNENTPFSKKDISTLLKIALGKYKEGKKIEALPGVFIEKTTLKKFLEDKKEERYNLFVLDKKGEDIINFLNDNKITDNSLFLLGDHKGLDKKDIKYIKKLNPYYVSLSNITYFTSQSLTILNYLLDRYFDRSFLY